MPSPMMGSATLQGIASQTANAPVVAITANSEVAQTIRTSCIGDPDAAARTFELPVGATILVQACSWRQLHDGDLNSIAALTAGQQAAPYSRGMSIRSDGLPGSFYAFGFALNGSPARAQLQPVDFYDPKALGSTRIVYAGVPVGVNNVLQPGTYVPVLTLANFSAQPRITTVRHLDSTDGPAKPRVIEELTLPPGSVRTIEFNGLPGSGLRHSFTLDSDGEPGDVEAHLFSYKASTDQRVEQLAKDGREYHNGGNHPWSVENGSTSTLLLFNPTAQKQEFQVRVSGGGATWISLLYLAPYETQALSINDLIAKQTPDYTHHALPRSLRRGEVQWSTRMPADGFGRVLVSNPAIGLSRSFSCPDTLVLCAVEFSPNVDGDIVDGDTATFSSVQADFCSSEQPSSCYTGTSVGTGFSFDTSWQASSNTQITGSTNSQVTLQGMSAGNFNYTGTVSSGSCYGQAGGSGTVQAPTIQIRSSGTKSAGDNLIFPYPPACMQTLGAFSCPTLWGFNVEVVINTPTSIAGYSFTQDVLSNFERGVYKNTITGVLSPFSQSASNGPDNPAQGNTQNQGTGLTIYCLDDPGFGKQYSFQNTVVDSGTLVINFQTQVCRNTTGACITQPWYEKVVVKPGGVLDTTNSSLGLGSMSTSF